MQYVSGNFTSWRWIILVGCLAPAYWLGEGVAHLFEAAVEWKFFENRRVLYYIIGTTVRLSASGGYLDTACRVFTSFHGVTNPQHESRHNGVDQTGARFLWSFWAAQPLPEG